LSSRLQEKSVALEVHAGPRALALLRERGLQASDVRAVPAAAGGPKGLILNHIDRFLFGDWLKQSQHTVHLLGASIGAWRMAVGCTADPVQGFADLAVGYIAQDYPHLPGKPPTSRDVSTQFAKSLAAAFAGHQQAVLNHPRYRLHVFTSRGRHVLHRQGKLRTPAGYAGAFAANAISRKALGGWLERVVFSDPRDALPVPLTDFRSHTAALNAANLLPSIQASCSIPFWLDAVHDIPGAPRGAYWDGGITDYHLHLNYAAMTKGVVLYPHFQSSVIPGWLDKGLSRRHAATPALDNLVLLSPKREWIKALPNGKLPDRKDFTHYGDDLAGRIKAWTRAVEESKRLADELSDWLATGRGVEVKPLV
jgi:hypothetical protein